MTVPDFARLVAEAAPEERLAIISALAEALAEALARNLAPVESANHEAADRLLSMHEVAKVLGVPEEHAREMGRRGELPIVRLGRYVRVRARSLAEWIDMREKRGLDRQHTARIVKLHDRSRVTKDPAPVEVAAGGPCGSRRRCGEHRG